MIEFLEYLDTRLFFLFNGHHTPFMDKVMGLASGKLTWTPLYILLLIMVWKKKQEKMWLVVLSVAILITLSDQVSVHLFKETFQRYRPCHNELIKDQAQLIDGRCGGLYGFVSSHAANSFALITFLSLFFRKKGIAIGLYFWASFVCYSRVYGGVHYPFDIVGGMMLGIFFGIIVYKFYIKYDRKFFAV